MALKYSSVGGGTGTGFNVQITSKYSYATFLSAQPAGSYTIKSAGLYTNWDVYLLDASNNLVAYTGGAAINPASSFSAIVILNGTYNDILQFSFQSTVIAQAENDKTKAGPFITAFGSSVIPNVNSAVTITGGNFAPGIAATFTGTDNVVRTCKSVVYTSTSSISVVRPDNMPIAYAPYTLTLTNPSVSNPTNSNSHILTGLTVGSAPSWTTGTSLSAASGGTPYSTTLVATDPDVGGSVTYSYVSGSLPSGLSFNASTGVISGTYNAFVDGSATYTVRATDAGGNYTDRTFTISYTGIGGGTLTSDSTYYYRTFVGNGTLQVPSALTVDILQIAGGGGGGCGFGTSACGGGGGAGGVLYNASYSLPAGNTTILVGAGGASIQGANTNASSGISSTVTLPTSTVLTAIGGGGGSTYPAAQPYPFDGGSGGGCGGAGGDSGSPSPQRGGFGTAGQGNNGGQHKGTGQSNSSTSAGGGGGAGAVGGDGSANSTGGSGGAGTTSYSSWLTGIASAMTGYSGWSTAVSGGYIAGGGGGGSSQGSGGGGGAGGGGSRGTPTGSGGGNAGANGTNYTGGGGGGASAGSTANLGGTGGSGLTIIRYTKASVGG
jgi:hypothetical protein